MGYQDLHAGKRVSVICTSESGDLPLEFKWLKNREALKLNSEESRNSITLKQNDEFSSVLTIHNLSSTHSGEYSCQVSNAASTVLYSSLLEVNGIIHYNYKMNG